MAYYIHKRDFGFRRIGIIISAIALVFLIIAVICFCNARYFLNNSIITTGEVVDVYTSRSKDYDGNYSTSKYPVVRFTESTGKIVEFRGSVSSNNAIIFGEKVNVRYSIDNPKNAELDRWIDIWFSTLIVSIFFVFFAFFGIAFLTKNK